MDEPTSPVPEIMPQAPVVANYGPIRETTTATPTPSSAPKKIPPLLIIGGVISIFLIGSFIFAVQNKSTETPTTTPTPSVATPTPTSTRQLNSFATQSAFIKFEEAVTQLPSIIQGAAIQDPTLGPPVLDLKLGFSN